MAVVSPSVSFVHRNHNQSSFGSFDVLRWVVFNLVASLLLRMVIPGDRLVLQYLRDFDETTQVDALPVGHDDFLLQDTGVANVVRFVANILRDEIFFSGYKNRLLD